MILRDFVSFLQEEVAGRLRCFLMIHRSNNLMKERKSDENKLFGPGHDIKKCLAVESLN